EFSSDAYRQTIAKFSAPEFLEKLSELDSLIGDLTPIGFDESLVPFIEEAGQAFDVFAKITERIRIHVDEKAARLTRARALCSQLGIPQENGVLSSPSEMAYSSFSDRAFAAVSSRVSSSRVAPFISGNRRGYVAPMRDFPA